MTGPFAGTAEAACVLFKPFASDFVGEQTSITFHEVDARKPDGIVEALAVEQLFGHAAKEASSVAGSLLSVQSHAFKKVIDLFHDATLAAATSMASVVPWVAAKSTIQRQYGS